MHHVPCTNTHHDVTNLVNHGMVILSILRTENIFSMKFLNLCLRFHILRSHLFVEKATFKKYVKTLTILDAYNISLTNVIPVYLLQICFKRRYLLHSSEGFFSIQSLHFE